MYFLGRTYRVASRRCATFAIIHGCCALLALLCPICRTNPVVQQSAAVQSERHLPAQSTPHTTAAFDNPRLPSKGIDGPSVRNESASRRSAIEVADRASNHTRISRYARLFSVSLCLRSRSLPARARVLLRWFIYSSCTAPPFFSFLRVAKVSKDAEVVKIRPSVKRPRHTARKGTQRSPRLSTSNDRVHAIQKDRR